MLAACVAGQPTRRVLSLLRPDRPRNPIAQFGFDERRLCLMKHPLGLGLTAQGPGPRGRAPGPGPGLGPDGGGASHKSIWIFAGLVTNNHWSRTKIKIICDERFCAAVERQLCAAPGSADFALPRAAPTLR